jgi:hypothetical protein
MYEIDKVIRFSPKDGLFELETKSAECRRGKDDWVSCS